MTYVAILFAIVATVYDVRSRVIPDWIAASLLACAALGIATGLSGLTWMNYVYGAALGFALMFPLYALGGFGGGDLKLVVAIGSALGPWALLSVLFWVAVSGGLLAIVALVRGRRNLAYVPAIACGLLLYWIRLEFVVHATAS
ncbi:MAG TPA: prepilin peptidase [Planctomycetaceae bacterium]|jgi:prepilin peptidase CpaA|nr:prepilin peptidase [Planctomycetaceae bacterium]